MKKFLLLCSFFLFASPTLAADFYSFDPDHTNITWSANHFGFSNPSGKFTKAEGYILIDETAPQNSSVKAVIKTDSLSTGLSAFDERLKTSDFFNTAKYPEATFVSKNIILRGRNATIIGDFTFLGVTNQVTLDAHLNRIGLNSYTQKRSVGFSASTTIRRSDYGMTFGAPGISDNVKINIEVEGFLDKTAKENFDTAGNNNNTNDLFISTPLTIVDYNSSINFTVEQDNSTVSGSFKNFEGKVYFDPTDLAHSAISIDIDISSINCSVNSAIGTLKTPEWFNVVKFPKANFTATQFIKTSDNKFLARGFLKLKGRKLATDVDFNIQSSSASGASAIGSTIIKRSDFDIGSANPDKSNGVKDNVQIKFIINARR